MSIITLHASHVTAPQCHPLDGSPQTLHGSNFCSPNTHIWLLSLLIVVVVVVLVAGVDEVAVVRVAGVGVVAVY